MARCSICFTLLSQGEPTEDCPDCQQRYHQGCWSELGGCATYGCKRAAVAQKPPPPVQLGAGWGDTKTCPACAQQISSSLLVCRCSARFPWADPMTIAEYDRFCADERGLATARKLLIGGFVLSLAGITAPLAGPLAGLYAWRKRKQLAGGGGTYLAIGYGSAALGAGYALLIALTAAGL